MISMTQEDKNEVVEIISRISSKINYVDSEKLVDELEALGFDSLQSQFECIEEAIDNSLS